MKKLKTAVIGVGYLGQFHAQKHKMTVCTQDKTLKKRLANLKIPVLTLKGGKVLESA